MSRYRGRHRKPSHTGRNAALISASGAFAIPLVAPAVAEAGPPGGWGPIISCESGGRASATNGSSTASGLFQFLDSTWASVGGSGRAKDASVAEQYARAERLYAARGTQPWNASKSCWAGKSGATPRITGGTAAPRQSEAPKVKPRSKAQRATTAGGLTGVRAADGTGAYICGPSTYRFAVCDPGDDGQVMQYPAFTGRAVAATPVGKATHVKRQRPTVPADLHRRDSRGLGSYTCDTQRLGYENCDIATLGQTVAYPAFDRH